MKVLFSSAIALLMAAQCLANPPIQTADDTKAIQQVSNEFYTSLNAMFTGNADPMVKVWSHAEDVTYLGPAGDFLVGWTKVRGAWQAQAALHLGGKVEPSDLHATVGDTLAFTQCIEKGTNHDATGNTVEVSIRATNLFRKENGDWKMIGHHTDVLPYLKDRSPITSVE